MKEAYQRLEEGWAKANDLDPAGMVCCSSGTAALHLSLEAMQLPHGSEILIPDLTMIACPRAATLAGLTPVFVDCGDDLLMDRALWASAVREQTNAIMFVHIYGRRCQMLPEGWGKNIGSRLRIIEDLAEAHGVKPHWQTDAACWSFFSNKIVSGAEGGAVWFCDPEHAKLARQLRSLGFTDAHDFMHVPRGHNYRMSNAHAELILANWKPHVWFDGLRNWTTRIEWLTQERRQIENWYDEACPVAWQMPRRDAVWVYDFRVPGMDEVTQNVLVQTLQAEGFAARHSFKPMHIQPEYKDCWLVTGCPVWSKAAELSSQVVYLPVRPGQTTREDCRRAFDVARRALGRP